MPSTTSLLTKLVSDYPDFHFKEGDYFCWSPLENVIFYKKSDKNFRVLILHELAHALLEHSKYDKDVQLLAIESQVWDKTTLLAKEFDVVISDDFIQENLDSYRDWLHKRSICPSCESIGVQIKQTTFKCLACHNKWAVNEAKYCRLKRRNISK